MSEFDNETADVSAVLDAYMISSIIQEKNVQMIRYRHVHSKVLTEIYMWHTEEPVLKDGEITDRDLWMNLQICRKQPRHILIMW